MLPERREGCRFKGKTPNTFRYIDRNFKETEKNEKL